MLWARVDYYELVSKKSSFLIWSEENPSAHCPASALQLVRCVFATNEWKSKSAMRLLLLLLCYSFISFSKRAKINFIRTISSLCIRLFLAICQLNTEMISWYHGLVYPLNVHWMSHLCKRAKRAMSRLKTRFAKWARPVRVGYRIEQRVTITKIQHC